MTELKENVSQLIKEQIQEDVITYMDGFPAPIIDGICDIVVANFKLSILHKPTD